MRRNPYLTALWAITVGLAVIAFLAFLVGASAQDLGGSITGLTVAVYVFALSVTFLLAALVAGAVTWRQTNAGAPDGSPPMAAAPGDSSPPSPGRAAPAPPTPWWERNKQEE